MSQKERQQRYVAKLKKKNRCLRCRSRAMKGRVLCKDCTISRRIYQRTKTKSNPWKKGGRGRPPSDGH